MENYYIYIDNGKINGKGRAKLVDGNGINFPVSRAVYEKDLKQLSWDGEKLVEDADYNPQETAMRKMRDEYLQEFVDPKQLVLVFDGLSDEEKRLYAAYRRYLLDYPESEATWYEKAPLTFAEWRERQETAEEIEQAEGGKDGK